jgi:hypothetical protein
MVAVPAEFMTALEDGLHGLGWTSGDVLHRLPADVWTVLSTLPAQRRAAITTSLTPSLPGQRREIGRAS